MAQQFTPWQRMRAYESQTRKIEDYWIKRPKKVELAEGEILVEPMDNCCGKQCLTYYNNGKCNLSGRQQYDYNFFYCEGYDQTRHRDDRKHPFRYMHIDCEEEFPCRTVTLLTSSNYGHRPPIDPSPRFPMKNMIQTFYRNSGTAYCMNANGYHAVNVNPTQSFKWNAQFGYTYSPPKN